MKLSKSIRARVHAASLTVQQLVFDAIIDAQIDERKQDASGAAGVMSSDLVVIDEFLRVRVSGTVPGSRRYEPDADAVAFGLGAVAGKTTAEIARFFEVEYEYAKLKLRRLREHARKA